MGMTRAELLRRMSSLELTERMMLDVRRHREAEARRKKRG